MLPRMPLLSLTQRSQLVFALASAAAIAAVAAGPWMRARDRSMDAQRSVWREVAQAWCESPALSGEGLRVVEGGAPAAAAGDPFVEAAYARFLADPAADGFDRLTGDSPARLLYARPLRGDDLNRARAGLQVGLSSSPAAWSNEPLVGMVVFERPGAAVARQIASDQVALAIVGASAWIAQLVLVRTLVVRGYLRAVRRLRDVADKVRTGDLNARSTLNTGDELQQLGEAFNRMVEALEAAQARLESINRNLDLKVGELSEANVGLFESNRLKSEFLANVSHELRTPLNSIIGFADLLEEIAKADPAADPKRLRYINNIQRSGRSLLDMINELLDMAKIEAGRMEVTIAPASVSDLAEGLQAIMRPVAQQRRIELEQRVPAELPRVETDAGKLQQILYNFMSNAIKFSPEDGVVIVGAEQVTRDGHAAVRISVTDHGPGIPADMQDTVFEKFRQVDATHTRRAGGTGLGLAICRELADLLECGVGLVSAPGRGSTFWVEVPLVHRPRQLKPLMG